MVLRASAIIGALLVAVLSGCYDVRFLPGSVQLPEAPSEDEVRACFGPPVETHKAGIYTSIETLEKDGCFVHIFDRPNGDSFYEVVLGYENACADVLEACKPR